LGLPFSAPAKLIINAVGVILASEADRDQRLIVFGRESTRHGDVLKIVEI